MPHIQHRWYGPPETIQAVRDALAGDPRVTGMIPPPDQPLRVLDGASALTVASTEALPLPPGLADDKPETITALQGSF